MLLFLEVMEKPYKSFDEIKKQWKQTYDDLVKEDPNLSFDDYIKEDYYDDGDYILDTETGICYKANDFFKKMMNQM